MKTDNQKTNDGLEMAWNDPGKGSKDPWGGNKKSGNQQIPPEMEEMLNKFKEKLGGVFGGKSNGDGSKIGGSNGGIFGGLGLLLIAFIVWLLSGIYIVEPDENGVVLRFGEYTETTNPGPHWHYPWPVEKVILVKTGKRNDIEIGGLSRGRVGNAESRMLTEDKNIVLTKFAIQYKIKNAKDYLFNVSNPEFTLSEVAQSAIRSVVGANKMDYVLTEGRAAIAQKVEKITQETLDSYNVGLIILGVQMKGANPPDQVQAAFADATAAEEDKERFINQAEAYRNEILPQARGEVARILAEANAYKEQIEAKATGEASRFSQIETEYRKAPEVTRERLYLETMEEVFADTGKIIMDTGASNSLMMLPLDKILSKVKSPLTTGAVKSRIMEEMKAATRTKSTRTGRSAR